MRIKKVLLSLALLLFITGQSFSQLKAIESFDYPLGTLLDTLNGDGGSGWDGAWDLFDGNDSVMTVADTGFVYDDLNYVVPNTGYHFIGANPIAWQFQRYGRYLAQRWPNEAGTVYWLSTLYELKNFTTNGWALVSLYDGTTEQPGVGHEWGNDSIGVATYNPMGHSSYTVNDGPQWLVAEIFMTGDTLNNVYLWVSPDPEGGEPDTSLADAKGSWGMINGFNRVAVHWGGEGVGMTMCVDEIRLGTSWADVSSPLTAVEENPNELPTQYALSQNYPNPFNPTTNISFSIKKAGFVKLSIYNSLGEVVSQLVNENLNAGNYERNFDASNLSSGIYLYKLETSGGILTRKMVLMK